MKGAALTLSFSWLVWLTGEGYLREGEGLLSLCASAKLGSYAECNCCG